VADIDRENESRIEVGGVGNKVGEVEGEEIVCDGGRVQVVQGCFEIQGGGI